MQQQWHRLAEEQERSGRPNDARPSHRMRADLDILHAVCSGVSYALAAARGLATMVLGAKVHHDDLAHPSTVPKHGPRLGEARS